MKQGTHKNTNKMKNEYTFFRCGTLKQLDKNFSTSSQQRSFIELEACGDTGTLIHLWGWGEMSFKRNVVKTEKFDPAISLLQIYPTYLLTCIHSNDAHYNIEITKIWKESKRSPTGNQLNHVSIKQNIMQVLKSVV